jgi:hypothetical protein
MCFGRNPAGDFFFDRPFDTKISFSARFITGFRAVSRWKGKKQSIRNPPPIPFCFQTVHRARRFRGFDDANNCPAARAARQPYKGSLNTNLFGISLTVKKYYESDVSFKRSNFELE